MYKMLRVLVFCTLLLSTLAKQDDEQTNYEKAGDFARCWGLPIAAGVGAVVAAPVVLPAIGFGAGGIAAGSWAASAMSAATTTGVGMGAISAAQSAGAAGLAVTTKAVVGGVSGLAAWYYGGCKDPDCDKNK